MAEWHDVAAASEVGEDMPLAVKVGEREIGIYRLESGYYALEDICPHAYALLSQGFVEGEEIECPLHGAKFHIPTGRCTKEPADRDIKTFPVRLEGGRIRVAIESNN
jgi:3-phenylpropionate/trans-cinnamate dioxygenase ferredoxin subunit